MCYQGQHGPNVQQPPQLEQHLTEFKDRLKVIEIVDPTWELEKEEEQHQLLSDYEDKCAEEVPNLTEQVETLEREAEVIEAESALQEAEARGWMSNSLITNSTLAGRGPN